VLLQVARHIVSVTMLRHGRQADDWRRAIEFARTPGATSDSLRGENLRRDAATRLAAPERHARHALAACRPADGWRPRAAALLALARFAVRPAGGNAAVLTEPRAPRDEAAGIIDPALSPTRLATVETFPADIGLEGIAIGDPSKARRACCGQWLPKTLACLLY